MSTSYKQERKIAELAVQRAAILTQRVFQEKVRTSVSKEDRSPVTIADFGSQALINCVLHAFFPNDGIIGEEESSKLRENAELRKQVWDLVSSIDFTSSDPDISLPKISSEDEMLKIIDLGCDEGGPSGRKWALDPIDGTLGFLRGGQYAIALALIVDGKAEVGILGCPNFPVSNEELHRGQSGNLDAEGERGIVVSAVTDHGCYEFAINGSSTSAKPVHVRNLESIKDAVLCESVESGHSAHGQQAQIQTALGIHKASVRMDSACKYAAVARGTADVYLRLPTSAKYQECIWDHVAGYVIIGESGGIVRDVSGKDIDFSTGRKLTNNKGFVVCAQNVYPGVAAAVKDAFTPPSI